MAPKTLADSQLVDTHIRVALVDSVAPVHRWVEGMLQPYAPRITLVHPPAPIDIALVDMHVGEHPLQRVRALVDDDAVAHVALLTTATSPLLVDAARAVGAAAVLVRSGPPAAFATALEQISLGRTVGFGTGLEHLGGDEAAALTERELDVLRLLGMGLSNRAIGGELYLGVETIRTHVRQIFRKLGVANRTQAALKATEVQLDEPPWRAGGAADQR